MRRCGRGAVISLAAGLVLAASTASPAAADSPHIRSTVETSRCATCHSGHAADGAAILRTQGVLGGAGSACLVCHAGSDSTATNVATGPVDSFDLPSGHSLATVTPGTVRMNGCATCHDSHGVSSAKRAIPAQRVDGVAVGTAGKELCLACHDSGAKWFGPGYPSTSLPTRDATGYPVAGTWPGSSTYESASSAHRLIPETTRTVGVSEPVRRERGDCLYCHAAHRGANAYDGLLTTYTVPSAATLSSDTSDGSYAALCFTCHGGTKPEGFTDTPVDIRRFVTAGATGGHAIVTSGGTLPVGSPLPCFECHNPHGSQRGNTSLLSDERGASLATTGAASVRAFCFTCHTTGVAAVGWDSETGTFTPGAAAETVVGLPRDGGVLHLPGIDGHGQGDPASCYDCHGKSYGVGGNNVHAPGEGSVSGLWPLGFGTGVPSTATVPPTATVPSTATVVPTVTVTATDTTPPVTTSDAETTYAVSATITLTAVDETAGAGIATTYWFLDGAQTATGTVVSTSAVGPHTLSYWSVDNAGNVEATTTVDFTVTVEQVMGFSPVREAWLQRLGTTA